MYGLIRNQHFTARDLIKFKKWCRTRNRIRKFLKNRIKLHYNIKKCCKGASVKHHYIPEFYSQNWIDPATNTLIEFSIRSHGFWARPTSPKGTGYEKDLYKIPDKNHPDPHWLETQITRPLDDKAAKALEAMRSGRMITEKEMVGWSSFLTSLLIRSPEDIEAFSEAYDDAWLNDANLGRLQEKYAKIRLPDAPPNVLDYYDQENPGWRSEAKFKTTANIMTHTHIATLIESMHWTLHRPRKSRFPFLTSDRPLLRTTTLTEENAYVIIPTSPTEVFIAGKNQETIQRIIAKKPEDLIRVINEQVTRHAIRVVYASDKRQSTFIQRRIATRTYPSLLSKVSLNTRLE